MRVARSGVIAAQGYADFAAFYDEFVSDLRYATWIAGLIAVAQRHGFAGGPALDVGCGTGLSTAPLRERCATVVGCEPVDAMARIAEERLPGIEIHRVAVTELPPLGRFDLVLMANDVINYVPGAELDVAFERLAANLSPAGVLLFDTNTLATYRDVFATTDVREAGARFVWRGGCDASFGEGERADATLEVFVGGALPRRISCRHVQFHHPPPRIKAALRQAGLRIAESYGQDADGRRLEDSDELTARKRIYVTTT